MKRKPDANFFTEGHGMYARYCSTKEQALKAMKQLLVDDLLDKDEGFTKSVKLENIKETRYYTHKRCDGFTFGDNTCFECGDQCGTNGRRAFIIYF